MRAASQAVLPGLVGFLGACALVGFLVDRRAELRLLPGSVEAQKFAEFRRRKDEFELVYVGTSRVLRGFDPATFEARLAELGQPLRAFNFGLVGQSFLEERHVVEWILAQRPARLRWLLLDATDVDVVMHRANQLAMRDTAWHTLAITWRGLRAAWQSERPRAEKLELTRLHALHLVKRACNLGTGAALLAPWVAGVEAEPLEPAGFGGLDGPKPTREPEERQARASTTWPTPVLWATLRELPELAAARRVQLRFVVPPTTKPMKTLRRAEELGELPELLVYDEAALPRVFEAEAQAFYDAVHLNRQGARLFSARLAEDLLPWLREP